MELTSLRMIQMSRRFLISQITESPNFPMTRVLYPSFSRIWHPATRLLAISLLSFMGAVLSVPGLSLDSENNSRFHLFAIGQPAAAQTPSIPDEDVMRYARAILDIEPIRQEATEELSSILETDSLPPVECNNASSYRGMSREARQVVVDYCNQSRVIVEGYELSIRQFNLITEQQRTNRTLRNRIQQELMRMQSPADR